MEFTLFRTFDQKHMYSMGAKTGQIWREKTVEYPYMRETVV